MAPKRKQPPNPPPKKLPSKAVMKDRIDRLMGITADQRATIRQRDQALKSAAKKLEAAAKVCREQSTDGRRRAEMEIEAANCRKRAEDLRAHGRTSAAEMQEKNAEWWTKLAKTQNGDYRVTTRPAALRSGSPKKKTEKKKKEGAPIAADYIPAWQR